MLKIIAPVISHVLSRIFNLSLNLEVPSEWKAANVVPIPKPGDSSDIQNYRPISICSAVGKVLERIVSNDLSNHLFMYNILSRNRHGFLPGRSCTTQISKLYHDWSSILNKRCPLRVDAFFLDWSRAFDKVPHPS